MIYKDFHGLRLSALGMGCMRLPVLDGQDGRIDEPAAREMVARAMERGINYYDTAYGYHDGRSEEVMGRILKAYPRDSFYLASKFPGYDLANMGKVEEIFEEQLRKCQVERFDFYLFHNVCERNIDGYLDPVNGIMEYLLRQKEAGRIGHLGFSVHGSQETLNRFLDAYGQYMEFCQIQLNWMDWTFQKAREKVERLGELGLPVWVMEPLRGGKLIRLTDEEKEKLETLRPGVSAADWCFRFLQSVPGVTMILSGMSNMEQLEDNIGIFETDRPLSSEERQALMEITQRRMQLNMLPCTACHYCTSHCPQGLDIPMLLEMFNDQRITGGPYAMPLSLRRLPEEKHPSACIGCRSCEAVCPQGIKIPDELAEFDRLMRG